VTQKQIKTTSIAVLILGFFLDSLAFSGTSVIHKTVNILSLITPNLNLVFIDSNLFSWESMECGISIHFLKLLFYILLLAGTVRYVKSGGGNTKFLLFFFTTLFIVKCTAVISGVILLLSSFSVIYLVLAIPAVLWSLISYNMVISFTESRDSVSPTWIRAPKRARFIHLIVDILLGMFTCSSIVVILLGKYSRTIAQTIGEYNLGFLIVILSGLIYYFILEAVLGTTPGKALTNSKVVSANDGKPKTRDILIRTVSRYIPFEPISHISQSNNWHDKLSGTQVVQKQRDVSDHIPAVSKVRSGKKWLWILLAVLTVVLSTVVYVKVKNYREYTTSKYLFDTRKEILLTYLNHLNESSMIQFRDNNYPSDSSKLNYYFKVEQIDQDKMTCSYFINNKYHSIGHREIVEKYLDTETEIHTRVLDFNDIGKSLKSTPEVLFDDTMMNFDLFSDGREFDIVKIFDMGSPVIDESGLGYSDDEITFYMRNDGVETELISIRNLDSDLEWQTKLPLTIEEYSRFEIEATNLKANPDSQFILTFRKENGREYLYEVTRENDFTWVKPHFPQ